MTRVPFGTCDYVSNVDGSCAGLFDHAALYPARRIWASLMIPCFLSIINAIA